MNHSIDNGEDMGGVLGGVIRVRAPSEDFETWLRQAYRGKNYESMFTYWNMEVAFAAGRAPIDASRARVCAFSGWQDIETAPKDGTEVLAWREDAGCFIASYTSADSFPMSQAELDECEEDWLFQKDWFTQWPQAIRLEGSEVPTHWTHLPPAPEGAKP